MKLEIYSDRNNVYTKELKLLDKQVSNENKALIVQFHNHLFACGSKELRISKLSAQLRKICTWLVALGVNKLLSELNKNDLVLLVSHIGRMSEKSENTRADYRRCIRQFYIWFEEEDPRTEPSNPQYQEAVKFYKYLKNVKVGYIQREADPETIITENDVLKVVNEGADNVRDKALIMTLHETGARVSEFLNLKIGSIVFKETYAEIHLPDGKTGRRVVYVVKSVPYLLKYLDCHPYRNNMNSFLWVTNSTNKRGTPLMHLSGHIAIKNAFEKAGVNKKCNWHWFRHSRATLLAPVLTEVLLCKTMGWAIGSRQVKTYVHLCSSQLENAFLKMHGISENEENKDVPIKCHCGTLNPYTERYCHRCSRPLSTSVVVQDKELIDNEMNKTIKFMMEMAKNPDLMNEFNSFKDNFMKKSLD